MDHLGSRSKTWQILIFSLAVLITIIYSLPFLYLMVTSLKDPIEAIAVPPTLYPQTWSLENYLSVWNKPGVIASIGNSFQIAVISTFLAIILGLPASYAAVRFGSFVTRNFLLAALVVRMIPSIVIGAPLVTWFAQIGILDTTFAVAFAHTTISLPLVVWLMAGFFEAIPVDIEEAALIDGCSRVSAFIRVVLPVTLGGVSVAAMFAFLSSWNEFIMSLLLTSSNAQTTPLAIANFQTQFGLDWGSMTAIAVIYSAPVILLTFALQRFVISGLTLGAVKG